MKIIIAGAGGVGYHLAELLAVENQDITLIDTNAEVLENAAGHLDVLIVRGDAASLETLNNAQVQRAQLFLAVTTSEKTNLLSAILAKQLGAKQTVARVNNPEYVNPQQKERFQSLGIDNVISPLLLAAQEIERLLRRSSFTDLFEFEAGKVSIIGITVDQHSPLIGKTFQEIDQSTPTFLVRAIAMLRSGKTIIPNGDMTPHSGDHLFFVTKKENIDALTSYVGKSSRKVRKVMIAGGSPLAKSVAQILEKVYSVTLIDNDQNNCSHLVDCLQNALVVKGNPSNIDLLKEEGLEEMDVFLALTSNSETNIVSSLMATKMGLYKTIALVDNAIYTHISHSIGVDTIVNKKIIAANSIFRFVRKGKIKAITSLHGVDAEIIEFIVHRANQLTKKTIRDLHFPEDALIIGVVRNEEVFIPEGNSQLALNDKVIVLVKPNAIGKLEKLFR